MKTLLSLLVFALFSAPLKADSLPGTGFIIPAGSTITGPPNGNPDISFYDGTGTLFYEGDVGEGLLIFTIPVTSITLNWSGFNIFYVEPIDSSGIGPAQQATCPPPAAEGCEVSGSTSFTGNILAIKFGGFDLTGGITSMSYVIDGSTEAVSAPEPSTLLLLLLGIVASSFGFCSINRTSRSAI